jgi:hypothetical protein
MQTARKHATGNVIHYLICRNCSDILPRAPSSTKIKNCVEIAVHKLSLKKKCDVCSVKEISYCNFLKILILCSKRRQTKLFENITL